MSPKSKDSRARLLEPLATDLAAFRAAVGLGNTEIGVIREAVRVYIDTQVSKDEDLRRRYETEKAKLIAAKVHPLRLVKNDSKPTE